MNCLISAMGVGQLCNKLKLLQGPSYLGYAKSVSWLLMSWILASSGHHLSWHWICKLCMFLSYMREDFHTIVVFVWRNYIDCRYISCFLCCGMHLKGAHCSILPDTITISIYVISTEMKWMKSACVSQVNVQRMMHCVLPSISPTVFVQGPTRNW